MFATLIATISFQNIVNPPGGVHPPGDIRAGQSVVAEKLRDDYILFLTLNSMFNFIPICATPSLHDSMCLILITLSLTYIVVLDMVTPNHIWDSTKTVFFRILYVWIALIGVVMCRFFCRLVVWVVHIFMKH